MTPSPEAGELTPDGMLAEVTKAIKPFVRKAADDIYERLLISVEDHLVDNATYNIGNRIEAAERERRIQWDRAELAEARLEEALSMREAEAHRNDTVHNGLEARAELAEQEASRWKAKAEKAVEALKRLGSNEAFYTVGKPGADMFGEFLARVDFANASLTSLRGDAP